MTTTPTTGYARVGRTLRGQAASDGAGVRLTRVIGSQQLPDLDPFLLLDEFGTDRPEDYLAGFPDHPHRGFETVTYMLDGRMRHKDNHGNEGVLVPGSVQWMTAGRGLVHSEMPEQHEGRMRGFQLWVNLPARDKMTDPRYQEFAPERIPQLQPADGVTVKLIAGRVGDVRGPIAHRRPIRSTSISSWPPVRRGSTRCRRAQRVRVRVRGRGQRRRRRGRTPAVGAGAGGAGRRRALQSAGRRGRRAPDPGGGAAAARAGRPARPVRDEHQAGSDAGLRRLPGGRF